MRFVEITDINDELLLPWLDLYEMSFPPREKVLVSAFLKDFKEIQSGREINEHMVAIVDDQGKLVGLQEYTHRPDTRVAQLWYFAVVPEARNSGLGGKCHAAVLERVKDAGARVAFWEVEVPEEMETPEERELATRRIGFYRRQGALMLRGIHHASQAAPHQPLTPYHLLLVPFEPMSAEEAFALAHEAYRGDVTQVGELGME